MPVDPQILEYLQKAGLLPAPTPTPVPDTGNGTTTDPLASVPASSASSTAPASLSPDIQGLIAAQNADADARNMAAVGRAGEMASSAISGKAANFSPFENTDQAVKDYVLRNSMVRKAATDKAAQDAAAAKAESDQAKADLAEKQAASLEEYRKAQIGDLTGKPEREATKAAAEEAYRKSQLDLAKERNSIARISANKPSGGNGFASGDGEGGFSDAALDQAAEFYHRTGVMLAMGQGKAGAQLRIKVANRAAELYPVADLAGNKAGYGADTASLKKLQQQADNIGAFERTGKKNLQVMLDLADKIPNLGSPALNRPIRWLANNAGDPSLTAFEAARQTFAVEGAKILSGALGPLSDSARHEVDTLLNPNSTPTQLRAAAKVFVQDFENRQRANDEQISLIRGRASGSGQAPGGGAPTVVERRKTASGKTLEKLSDGTIREVP